MEKTKYSGSKTVETTMFELEALDILTDQWELIGRLPTQFAAESAKTVHALHSPQYVDVQIVEVSVIHERRIVG